MKMIKRSLFKSAALALAITALSTSSAGASGFHMIKKGDTLWGLSQKYGLTVDQLKDSNNLGSNVIYSGDKLRFEKMITIEKGDTLWSLARKHHTTAGQLKYVNGLNTDTIYAGQKLIIPAFVLVRTGDTLWGISQTYGMTVDELKRNNNLKSSLIFTGKVLKVNKLTPDKAAGYDADKVVPGLTPRPGYYYTAEEPRKFILQYASDDTYITRVEVIGAGADIGSLKKQTQIELRLLGKVTELPSENSLPFYKGSEFVMHAHDSDVQKNIAVKRVDGVLLKFTIHYRNAEESEGIVPEMLKMLNTIEIK
jgi:LysM repeat protein